MPFRFLPLLLTLAASPTAVAAETAPAPCIFCAIAAGRTGQADREVFRDDLVVAFMDHAPRNPGHLLVVPLRHAENALDVPPATLAHLAVVAQRLAQAIRRTDLRAEGFNLQTNAGRAAGQNVFHLHVHVIPRFEGEPPAGGAKVPAPAAELAAAAAKIRAALAAP
jgi:histidine triad (HIT) family protein